MVPGTAFTIGPENLLLKAPATATLHFDPGALAAGVSVQALGVYVLGDGVWTAVNGMVLDPGGSTLTFPLDILGTYAILTPPPRGSVVVTPTTLVVVIGSSLPLAVEVRDTSGHAMPNAPVTWSSADSTTVSVSQRGLVTALGLGTVPVTAASGGKSAQVMIFASYICSCSGTPSSPAGAAAACSCAGGSPPGAAPNGDGGHRVP
jgi:hypothetical protein